MPTTDLSQREDQATARLDYTGLPERHAVGPRPRPRTRPPSAAPRAAFQSRPPIEAFFPPLFIGALVLVFLGSLGYLLWEPADRGEYELTPEEIHVLNGGVRYGSALPEEPASVAPVSGSALAADATLGSAALFVDTAPTGAVVSIDGEVAGLTPLRLQDLPARWHIVTLEREGFLPQDTLVYLGGDATTTVSLALVRAARQEETPVQQRPESVRETEPSRAIPPAAPTSGSLRVRVVPAGVPVQLDGETVGVAPLELNDLAPGPHTLRFFLPDYETATVNVDVKPGARESVEVTLIPKVGNIAVIVRPWGSIYIDDALLARNTDVRFDATLTAGRHRIRVVHPELGTQERVVEVQPDGTTTVTFNFE